MNGPEGITLNRCTPSDVERVVRFVGECPPLDLHSSFTYWVTFEYWGEMCFVASRSEQIVGYVSAIGSGRDDNVFYLWQIGVSGEFRSMGVSQRLLVAVVDVARGRGYRKMQVSIASGNDPSLRTFQRFALSVGNPLERCGEVSFEDAAAGSVREDLYTLEIA
jgi:L-2,4-diaminobutyric acid acetyltransferase